MARPEDKLLARKLSDSARKVKLVGNTALIPHKIGSDGKVLTEETFDIKRDLSKLNLNDLRFLVLYNEVGFVDEMFLSKCGLQSDQAERTLKKLAYFKTEDARIRALASQATPERILAKDMESVESGGTLNDSQHRSLDRIAKIKGAFKTTEVNLTQNVFNMPSLSPEIESEFKALAKKALAQEAEVVEERHVA